MGYDSVVPALGLEVIMTLQHLLHPRMVFTYALDTAFQDIGVAAILGVTFGLFTGGVFASLAFFFAFCSWVYSIFNVVSRCFSFPFHLITSSWHVLSSTMLLRTYFSSHARLPASGHLRYGFGLEHDILNSF